MKFDPTDYWNPLYYKINSEINIKRVEQTIDDFKINEKKIMICGRGESTHPDFFPRFSTPTTNIDSNLYVIVDHNPNYKNNIIRKGNYALSVIVDPKTGKKILEIGGKIFWFSHEILNNKLPKILSGKFPLYNSGLTAISIATYLNVKYILLSGIKFTGYSSFGYPYNQFLDGMKMVIDNSTKHGTKIFSLDGLLAEKITYSKWCKL